MIYTKIRRFRLIHFLGKTDIIITANASSLIFAKKKRPVVFSCDLKIVRQSTGISFKVAKSGLAFFEGFIIKLFFFLFVEFT
jgi:hypothetical protein